MLADNLCLHRLLLDYNASLKAKFQDRGEMLFPIGASWPFFSVLIINDLVEFEITLAKTIFFKLSIGYVSTFHFFPKSSSAFQNTVNKICIHSRE